MCLEFKSVASTLSFSNLWAWASPLLASNLSLRDRIKVFFYLSPNENSDLDFFFLTWWEVSVLLLFKINYPLLHISFLFILSVLLSQRGRIKAPIWFLLA
jgi:hypothetical protein